MTENKQQTTQERPPNHSSIDDKNIIYNILLSMQCHVFYEDEDGNY